MVREMEEEEEEKLAVWETAVIKEQAMIRGRSKQILQDAF